jgi:hypothetical protein
MATKIGGWPDIQTPHRKEEHLRIKATEELFGITVEYVRTVKTIVILKNRKFLDLCQLYINIYTGQFKKKVTLSHVHN